MLIKGVHPITKAESYSKHQYEQSEAEADDSSDYICEALKALSKAGFVHISDNNFHLPNGSPTDPVLFDAVCILKPFGKDKKYMWCFHDGSSISYTLGSNVFILIKNGE